MNQRRNGSGFGAQLWDRPVFAVRKSTWVPCRLPLALPACSTSQGREATVSSVSVSTVWPLNLLRRPDVNSQPAGSLRTQRDASLGTAVSLRILIGRVPGLLSFHLHSDPTIWLRERQNAVVRLCFCAILVHGETIRILTGPLSFRRRLSASVNKQQMIVLHLHLSCVLSIETNPNASCESMRALRA
jgi:hypothetical protein